MRVLTELYCFNCYVVSYTHNTKLFALGIGYIVLELLIGFEVYSLGKKAKGKVMHILIS